MTQTLGRVRLWVAAHAAACLLVACQGDADIVGELLPLEAGPASDASMNAGSDAAAVDAAMDTRCEPMNRFKRARLPEQLVLDVYMKDCKIPLQDFMPKSGQPSISAQEFSMLLRAQEIMAPPGTPAALFCDPMRGGYYVEPWDKPERFVLCPATCEIVKNEIERVLSLDGCDPQSDDAGTP